MSTRERSSARLLGAYLVPHRRAVAGLAVALLGATALPLLNPQLLRAFVDDAIAGSTTGRLLLIAGAYLAIALAGQAVQLVATYLGSKVAWTSTNALREDLVAHVLELDMGFHGCHTAGELIERVDGDVFALGEVVSKMLFQLLGSGLLLVGAVVAVGREDGRFAAVLGGFLVVTAVLVARFQRYALPAATADREAEAQLIGNVEERLAGADEIRALGATDHVLRRFEEVSHTAFRAALSYERTSGGLLAITNFAFSMATAALLVLGVMGLRNGALTVGTVVLLFQYTMLVRQPLRQVVSQFKELQKAAAGATRVVELLKTESPIDEPHPGVALPSGDGLEVRFEAVSFAYDPSEPVLRDIDLVVAPGRSLGLVGRTGSGKSTLARLLLRLYDPTGGRVVVGGIDLREVAPIDRRSRLAIVTQDVQLFGASVRDNLTLFQGRGEVGDEKLLDVIDRLGLRPWLDSLDDGLDSVLGPGGSGVSAGEAQLLAFARVFLADPSVVVLDEATSRLDPATEELIERAIAELLVGRTAVVIAHRLSSLERVDDIAVIDGGRVIEHGLRAELAADAATRFGALLALSREHPEDRPVVDRIGTAP